ncbi:MAG: hypothetical protein BGO83_25880 [Devosia sp. 66-14]|jgi:hypothetical protein|nr:MAG: hypothetical protein ABS47_20765 [Devosia sp. SCN 66-27]OJX27222.1 MAG: hypothetical protein BGO83_25880 [Devosia sp. 66-14]
MNGGISPGSSLMRDKRNPQIVLSRMSSLKVLALSAVLAAILVSLMPDGEQAMGSGMSTVRADGREMVLPASVPERPRAV